MIFFPKRLIFFLLYVKIVKIQKQCARPAAIGVKTDRAGNVRLIFYGVSIWVN